MPPKRKATTPSSSAKAPIKKFKKPPPPPLQGPSPRIETKKSVPAVTPVETFLTTAEDSQHDDGSQGGLILREYYPPELSNERAQEYMDGDRQRPIEALKAALVKTSKARGKIPLGRSIVHWFRGDLRLKDNTALGFASTKAQNSEDGENLPLVGIYLVSPQDFEAHLTSPAKVDFILRTLKILQEDLDKLNIPLHIEVVECRKDLPRRVLELASGWGANHIYANMEYEVDELRRDTKIIEMGVAKGVDFSVHHDLCVVKPGELVTKVS